MSIERNMVPSHIAIIMDGNGRWAKAKGLPRSMGHNAGMKAMKKILTYCGEIGVDYLTVYAFSTENWKRSQEEIGAIFNLLVTYVAKELKNLMKNNVKVNIFGDIEPLPKGAKEACRRVLKETAGNTGINFNIALNYGSREEIRMAMINIARKIEVGEIKSDEITTEHISANLYSGIHNVPDPELIIRTSGEERLSNFLLWQCAYSEFVFSDSLWPDFGPKELDEAIAVFRSRDRRFGGR